MKKLSLLWILSAGMFMFSCGGSEEGTEDDVAATEQVADHECCSAACADDCEIHAEEKKMCTANGDKSKCGKAKCDKTDCDKSKCDMSKCDNAKKCDKADCDKSKCDMSKCDMSKCDKSNCDASCTKDHAEEAETEVEEATAA
ncbi:hypothetical protein N8987_00650 [Crocinitomix sp.]|nr:hypothetical protein [Crocinitomix sp.]